MRTSVKEICKRQSGPYFEFSLDCPKQPLLGARLNGLIQFTMNSPYVYAGRVNNVHMFGRSFVYTQDGHCVYNNQSFQNHKEYKWEESKAAYIDSRTDLFTSYIDRECIFLGGMNHEPTASGLSHTLQGGANFGHFIFEYLNRLVIFDALGLLDTLPVVVYDCLPERYLGWLKLFGVREIIKIPVMTAPAFKTVWVSSACHYRGTDGTFRMWDEGLHWLRGMARKARCGSDLAAKTRLYMGREHSGWRNIVNEAEVKSLLNMYNFKFPDLQTFSPEIQLDIISGSAIVVAAAGAGTVLTHFAPEHCVVINVCPHPQVGTGPWGGLGASLFLRQIYDRLDGELVNPTTSNLNVAGIDERADYKVDVGLLEQKVVKAIDVSSTYYKDDALRC